MNFNKATGKIDIFLKQDWIDSIGDFVIVRLRSKYALLFFLIFAHFIRLITFQYFVNYDMEQE